MPERVIVGLRFTRQVTTIQLRVYVQHVSEVIPVAGDGRTCNRCSTFYMLSYHHTTPCVFSAC